MKLVHLTVVAFIAALLVAAPQEIRGQETGKDNGGISCNSTCNKSGSGHGVRCSPTCNKKDDSDCMVGRYGYGKAPDCEKAKPGEPCSVHGYGPCPEQRVDLGLGLRQAFTPSNQPYFGMQPLGHPRPVGPRVHGTYGYGHGVHSHGVHNPGFHSHGLQGYGPGMYPPPPRFPRLQSFFVPPPIYMTTAPQPPMPTYTTRGPRDFLNPNPPSIGY